jgi:hypothetical protein
MVTFVGVSIRYVLTGILIARHIAGVVMGARTHADVSLFSKLQWLMCKYKTTTTHVSASGLTSLV